jgi:hypothetical protein
VIGLVIEAILKIASVRIGTWFSASMKPRASKCTTLPFRAINVTVPATKR